MEGLVKRLGESNARKQLPLVHGGSFKKKTATIKRREKGGKQGTGPNTERTRERGDTKGARVRGGKLLTENPGVRKKAPGGETRKKKKGRGKIRQVFLGVRQAIVGVAKNR